MVLFCRVLTIFQPGDTQQERSKQSRSEKVKVLLLPTQSALKLTKLQLEEQTGQLFFSKQDFIFNSVEVKLKRSAKYPVNGISYIHLNPGS